MILKEIPTYFSSSTIVTIRIITKPRTHRIYTRTVSTNQHLSLQIIKCPDININSYTHRIIHLAIKDHTAPSSAEESPGSKLTGTIFGQHHSKSLHPLSAQATRSPTVSPTCWRWTTDSVHHRARLSHRSSACHSLHQNRSGLDRHQWLLRFTLLWKLLW